MASSGIKIEFSLPLTAQENMDEDSRRLFALSQGDLPHLRFLAWKRPSLTYGYFVKPEEWLHLDRLSEAGWDIGRRPTGGGILFHTHDVAFSLLIPKGHPFLFKSTLENYHFIHQIVQRALRVSSSLTACFEKGSMFCMAKPTVYDVVVEGKKVVGAAERRVREGLLHQVTVACEPANVPLLSRFLKDPEIVTQIEQTTYPLNLPYSVLRERLTSSFQLAFT